MSYARPIPLGHSSHTVIFLVKKSVKTEVGNYRPVSILSIISKVFERVVYDQIETYLDPKSFCTNFSPVLDVAFPMIHV